MKEKYPHRGISYNKEEGAEFYNYIYTTSNEYKKNFRDSSYYNLYKMTLEILIQNQSKSILEAGCGCGIFASMLYKSKYKVKYCGFDFSSVGLDRARKNCPNYKFIFDNIYTSQLYETHDYDTVISHEVLEHLNDDISFLRKLKKDTLLIASVPEFDCDSHVRYFTNENQILFRYKRCANIDKILYTDKMFLFYGKIK